MGMARRRRVGHKRLVDIMKAKVNGTTAPLDAASPPKDDEALVLLAKWARLHAVRTCLSLLGFIVLLVESIQQ
jgi:hypothetical protein